MYISIIRYGAYIFFIHIMYFDWCNHWIRF